MAQRPVTSSGLDNRFCSQIGDSTAAKLEGRLPPWTTRDSYEPAAGCARLDTQGQKPGSGSRCSSRMASRSPTVLLLYDQTSHLPAAVGTSTSTAVGQLG